MDVEKGIEGENVGTNISIKEEVKKDEGGTLREMSEGEEEIWKSRREKIDNAFAAARNAERQDPTEVPAAARSLENIIKNDYVEQFISEIERLANEIDPSAIFNWPGPTGRTLLHVAASALTDNILRLLLYYIPDHLIASQDDCGDTPLNMAIAAKKSGAAARLICRIRDLPNVEDKKKILRIRNRHGNTALHIAVVYGHADGAHHLLNEDSELLYLKNTSEMSPLYLAVLCKEHDIHEAFFSLPLEPSRIQGLPPIHGAILQPESDLAELIFKKNEKLFAMIDSRGGNVFHLAAYINRPRVFKLLGPKTEGLARQRDMNGDLPIHTASKMGYVELVEKLLPVSGLPNGQGQNVLHVAAKYGRTSVVRYMLRHAEPEMLINSIDHAGNTPSHLAALYSQPAALILLVMDERNFRDSVNHACLTASDIAQDRFRREPTLRNRLTLMVVSSLTSAVGGNLLVLRPEARDEEFSTSSFRKNKIRMDLWKDSVNTRLLVATLVATVTFAAGFAIPGGFNGSETTSKDDRGMASLVDKRLFQAFAICNTIAMFCSMIAVINLVYAQQHDIEAAIAAYLHSGPPLTIALPAMSVAFLTGVTLTVDKLPWLANTIFYSGLVFLLIISGATCIEYPPCLRSHHLIRRLTFWLVRAYIYFWGVETYLLEDSEDGETTSGTSAVGL